MYERYNGGMIWLSLLWWDEISVLLQLRSLRESVFSFRENFMSSFKLVNIKKSAYLYKSIRCFCSIFSRFDLPCIFSRLLAFVYHYMGSYNFILFSCLVWKEIWMNIKSQKSNRSCLKKRRKQCSSTHFSLHHYCFFLWVARTAAWLLSIVWQICVWAFRETLAGIFCLVFPQTARILYTIHFIWVLK